MGTSSTRGAALWLVGAAVVGGLAAFLHVMRTDLGGAHSSLGLAVSAYVMTALAALMIYRGIIVAARAQDASEPPRAGLPSWWDDTPAGYDPRSGRAYPPEGPDGWDAPDERNGNGVTWSAERFGGEGGPEAGGRFGGHFGGEFGGDVDGAVEDDEVYTFRRGRQIDGRGPTGSQRGMR